MASSSSQEASSSSHQAAVQVVRAYVTAQAFSPGSLPPPLTAAFQSHTLTLLQLIRILGEDLTSEDELVRSRGVELLAQTVLDLAPGQPDGPDHLAPAEPIPALFDRQAVKTLTSFFADKIEDGSNVSASIAKSTNSADKVVPGSAPSFRFKAIPEGTEMLACTLRALKRLASLKGFGSQETKVVAQSLISNVTPRDHPQAVRFLVYALLDALVSRHRSALKSMGKSFLKGYVNLAEGEKDPRNLMYLFTMNRVILIEWELDEELAEDFFDITYCYFPITFRPPPDDPYGITTEDLKEALRSCLIANPLLAPHAMPLLLEKLAASGGNTKRDTLHTLELAMPVFGKAAVQANEKKLWEGFKIEIMAATDEETALYAQRALSSFLRVLYHDVDPAEGIATRIIADAQSELEEPEKSLAKPACELLVAMVKACPSTASLAVYALLDQMLTIFKDPDVVSIRAPVLGHIATILKALRDIYNPVDIADDKIVSSTHNYKFATPSSSASEPNAAPSSESITNGTSMQEDPVTTSTRTYDGDSRPLDAMRDELLAALSNGLRSSSYRSSALLAFVHLTHIPTFLSAAETNYMAEAVNDLILSPSAEDIRGAALDGLRDIARVNPMVLEETTLPILFSRLPDRIPPPLTSGAPGSSDMRGVIRRSLGALARLCSQPDLFDMLIVKLFTKLDLTCATDFSSAEERESNIGYARGIIVTVLTVLEEKVGKGHGDLPRYGVTLCPRLFALVLAAASGEGARKDFPPLVADDRVLRDIGRLMTVLTRCLAADKQRKLARWMCSAFLEGGSNKSNQTSDEGTNTTSAFTSQVAGSPAPTFEPLNPTSPTSQKDAMFVFAAAFVTLKKEVDLPTSMDTTVWLQQLLAFTVNSSNSLQADAGFNLLAATVNKYVSEPLPSKVQDLLEQFWAQEVDTNGRSSFRSSRAVRAWFWVSKALVVRNSVNGQPMIEKALSSLFSSPHVGKEAARAIGLVAEAEDGVLSKDNGATIRLLYRQKLFAYLLPRIIEGYKSGQGSEEEQTIYLIALASVLPSMPRQMTAERLDEIFPLLIRALDLPDSQARWSAAATITLATALGKKERDEEIRSGASRSEGQGKRGGSSLDLVQDHLSTLITRLLHISRPSKDSPQEVRIAALRCLSTIGRCVGETLLRGQAGRVLKGLNGPGWGVDDPKKAVRVEGVDCKAVWHAVN